MLFTQNYIHVSDGMFLEIVRGQWELCDLVGGTLVSFHFSNHARIYPQNNSVILPLFQAWQADQETMAALRDIHKHCYGYFVEDREKFLCTPECMAACAQKLDESWQEEA